MNIYYNNTFCWYKNWFIPHGGGIGGGGITPGDFSNQFFLTDRKWAEDMVSFLMSFIHKKKYETKSRTIRNPIHRTEKYMFNV